MSTPLRSILSATVTLLVVGVLCIVGGFMLPFEYAGSVGPAWLPILIGAALIVCAIGYIVTAMRADEQVEWTDRAGWLTIAGIFGSFVVFLVIAQLTFFAVGAAAFIFLFLTSIRTYSIVKRILIAVIAAAAIHVLFVTLLGLPLPGAHF